MVFRFTLLVFLLLLSSCKCEELDAEHTVHRVQVAKRFLEFMGTVVSVSCVHGNKCGGYEADPSDCMGVVSEVGAFRVRCGDVSCNIVDFTRLTPMSPLPPEAM